MECGCDGMRGLGRESMGKAITKDSVFDSMRRVEAALKLRYMGIGFVWAWLYCSLMQHRQCFPVEAVSPSTPMSHGSSRR